MTREQTADMTDEELSFALQDINDTSRLHDHGTPYYEKLLSDYDLVIEEMGHRRATEYARK
jgi:hypothetical protein